MLLDSRNMNKCKVYCLILLSVSYVLSEKCADVGPFGIQYKNDRDNVKERLRGAKIDIGKLPKYNKTFVFLYYGHAPFFCKDILEPLSEVRVLKIYNFEINEIEAGAFNNSKYLNTIGIYQNNIRVIKKGVFNNLNISRLVLDKNGIVSIEKDAFDNMNNLRLISIEQNKLTAINPEWFFNCPHLHILYLENNRIANLPMEAFRYLQTNHNCDLKIEDNNCPQIWLQGNRIKNIHPRALHGLRRIQNIMLGNNELENIPNIFENIDISVISLEYNELSCLSDDVINSLAIAETVYLGGNNISKECMKKIDSVLNTESIIVYKLRLTDEDEE